MGGATLLIAPFGGWVDEMEVFRGTGAIVLDQLLMNGFAGVYFKRLRVLASLHPAMRAEYDRRRHQYLTRLLGKHSLNVEGVVIVGTHPNDVDLLEFDRVVGVRMSDYGMREMSKFVYGDPAMLFIEYESVLRDSEYAIDEYKHSASWPAMTAFMLREFPNPRVLNVDISVQQQKVYLADILRDEPGVKQWMEEDLSLTLPAGRLFLMADYDYLRVIRPKWRDAVVRALGSAPRIEEVFRLPWYLVAADALQALCFRPDMTGKPAVSMRGSSLVNFVQTRMSQVFSTRELMGTWVGAFLCDDLTAMDTVVALRRDTLAAAELSVPSRDVDDVHHIKVPQEYAWMYEAVPDVRVVEWDGLRYLNGRPKFEALHLPWAASLRVAEVFMDLPRDSDNTSHVVQFMRRVHCGLVGNGLLNALVQHARDIYGGGTSEEVFDFQLTPMLPGFNYLYCYPGNHRRDLCIRLGSFPSYRRMLECAREILAGGDHLSLEAICAEVSRQILYSGQQSRVPWGGTVVGDDDKVLQRRGFCYLSVFRPRHRLQLAGRLGPYPKLQTLFSGVYRRFFRKQAWRDTWVTVCGPLRGDSAGSVLHFSSRCAGVRLRVFYAWFRALPEFVRMGCGGVSVGAERVSSSVVVDGPLTLGKVYCAHCDCLVKAEGHSLRCRPKVQGGWSTTRKRAWFGDSLHRLDVQFIAARTCGDERLLEQYVQRYAVGTAMAQYMRQHHGGLSSDGDKYLATLFESSYEGDFRRKYLGRLFPLDADRTIRSVPSVSLGVLLGDRFDRDIGTSGFYNGFVFAIVSSMVIGIALVCAIVYLNVFGFGVARAENLIII